MVTASGSHGLCRRGVSRRRLAAGLTAASVEGGGTPLLRSSAWSDFRHTADGVVLENERRGTLIGENICPRPVVPRTTISRIHVHEDFGHSLPQVGVDLFQLGLDFFQLGNSVGIGSSSSPAERRRRIGIAALKGTRHHAQQKSRGHKKGPTKVTFHRDFSQKEYSVPKSLRAL